MLSFTIIFGLNILNNYFEVPYTLHLEHELYYFACLKLVYLVFVLKRNEKLLFPMICVKWK